MKRSKFSLSNYKLFSSDMGSLVPIGLLEVLPGDSIQQSTSLLVRVSPLLTPVMHPVHVRIHHWFVPHRLVWDDWENFITGGPDGMDASTFPVKDVGTGGVSTGSLSDYLGLPPGVGGPGNPPFFVSALPFRGYNLIWNEWYRDQDLQVPIVIDKTSGTDTDTPAILRNIAWEKDYFTSSRPWTQKGPEVTLPFGQFAPVVTNDLNPLMDVVGGPTDAAMKLGDDSGVFRLALGDGITGPEALVNWGTETGLQADLSGATAVSINALREAFAIQRYEEARARYGSRYTEYLRYLGVKSSDARLQRPEYLGGGKQTIQFSEVLQTAPDSDDNDVGVGDLKGHGIGAVRSNRYRRFFEEHGYIFSLMSVKPKTIYAQGIPRTWNRALKEDFFQKELQAIGQQAVLNKELYAVGGTLEGIFGYQDRYDEYRRSESTIAGDFRTTLDMWHYARLFATPPVLNSDFVTSVPTKRVNAVQSEHVLWVMANHNIQARRLVNSSGKSFIY